ACSSPVAPPAAVSDGSSPRRNACIDAPAPRCVVEAPRCDPAVSRSDTRWRSCPRPPASVARSTPCRPSAAPARAEPVRSPLFSQGVLDDLVLKHLLGQQLLQPPVLGLQLLHPPGVGDAHATELATPQVVRGLAEAVLATQLLHRHAGLRLTQEAD